MSSKDKDFRLPEIYFRENMSPMNSGTEGGDKELEAWRRRLKEALDARNLSYKNVSKQAGFNDEYVSKMLNGRINPTVDKIVTICEVAGIEPSFLFLSDNANERTIRALIEAMELPEEDASLVARLLASARAK